MGIWKTLFGPRYEDVPRIPSSPSGMHPGQASELIIDEGVRQEIMMLLRSGRKIEAIKVYREKTGVGLKEAKDAVERLESQGGG